MTTQLSDSFAAVLSYPMPGYNAAVANLGLLIMEGGVAELRDESGEAIENQVALFLDETKNLSLEDFEELYTRTFDINPITSLEIGWHLFGETYERGAFLVNMRELLRSHHIQESTELPDHLTHVLKLVGRMGREQADVFARSSLQPALKKMLEGFAKHSSPYEHVLQVLAILTEQPHPQGVSSHD